LVKHKAMRTKRASGKLPPTPGEVLREWQRGACEWLQTVSRSAQQIQQAAIYESTKAAQHLQRQHNRRNAKASRHAAFASLSGSLPASPSSTRTTDRLQFSGKGMNCIIGDLADGAISADPQKGQATAGKAAGEEQERILVSEVRLPLQHGLNQKPKCTQMSLETHCCFSDHTPMFALVRYCCIA